MTDGVMGDSVHAIGLGQTRASMCCVMGMRTRLARIDETEYVGFVN